MAFNPIAAMGGGGLNLPPGFGGLKQRPPTSQVDTTSMFLPASQEGQQAYQKVLNTNFPGAGFGRVLGDVHRRNAVATVLQQPGEYNVQWEPFRKYIAQWGKVNLPETQPQQFTATMLPHDQRQLGQPIATVNNAALDKLYKQAVKNLEIWHMRRDAQKKGGFGGQLMETFRDIGPVVMPMLGGVFGPSISSALSGTALGDAISAITTALGELPAPVSGALKGAAMSGITGGDPLKGAFTGGIGGLGGMVAGSMGFDPQIGSTIAKQGLGMYRQNQAQEGYQRAMQQWQLAQMARRSPFPQRTV